MDDLAKADILRILQSGTMTVDGVLPWSSNYTFLVTVCEGDSELTAVYKPRRGERPLWDFPHGTLNLRERGAFVISECIGWGLVPPTVLRNGDHGQGSVQLFIPHDPDQHYFVVEGDPMFRTPLQKMVLMDYVINNADRKGGHVIIETGTDESGDFLPRPEHLWGIDHGICFHKEYKLRTVIWEFANELIPPKLFRDLRDFNEQLNDPRSDLRLQLTPLLSKEEIAAMARRTDRLLANGVFPSPGPGRHYPWPPV